MKTVLSIIAAIVCASIACSAETVVTNDVNIVWSKVVRQWHFNETGTMLTPVQASFIWQKVGKDRGRLIEIVAEQGYTLPTKAQLRAVATAGTADVDTFDANATSPDEGFSTWTRKERFLVRALYRLAKQHWPALTLEQFRTQLKADWEATPESE